jgi:hypothetical protein
MNVRFLDLEDGQNPLNGSIVGQSTQLMDLLSHLQGRPPFFCELIGESGYKLLLGIGGPRGCIQHSRADGDPPYLMAVADESQHSNEDFEFLIGGTLTPVASRFCVQFKTVREIAAHFQMTGERSPKTRWEAV